MIHFLEKFVNGSCFTDHTFTHAAKKEEGTQMTRLFLCEILKIKLHTLQAEIKR